MKLLKRVRIINWHYFTNVIFDLDQVNFLTGQNAAGKSTLIDAMQIVLLGDTSGRTFNKAANEKSGRTLKGYLKGEIGDDGEGSFKYLRTGRFSSYIVLEWEDDTSSSRFLTGIVFDVYDDSSEEHHFFTLKDGLPENLFVENGVPLSYKQLQDFFANNYQDKYYFADSNASYQTKIKELFGNLKNKYFSLFKKAVSFTPITNIEQFLTEYVCDVPSEINIESMRGNIQNYKRLELEAENMQEKISKLETISTQFKDYKAKRESLDLSSFISKRITYQLYLNQITNFQKDIETGKNRLVEIDKQLEEIDREIVEATKQRENYIKEKVSSGSYNLTMELTNARDNLQKQIDEIEEKLKLMRSNFTSYVNNFDASSKRVLGLIEQVSLDPSLTRQYHKEFDSLKDVCEKMIASAKTFKETLFSEEQFDSSSLEKFRDAVSSYKEVITDVYASLKNRYAELIASHQQAKQQIVDMQQGSKMYEYQFKQIKSELSHRLSDHFGEVVEVLVFADLVDIKTPKWVKAVEGYLGNQKLNLFVEDKYYLAANKILPSLLREHNFYKTGLVDSRKLHEFGPKTYNNSLAEEILTDHQGARDYADFILGGIVKCNDFEEARESGHGITTECVGYRNFSSFTIPARNYQYPLLGRKISQETLKVRSNEINAEQKVIDVLKSIVDTLGYATKLEAMNTNEVNAALLDLDEASNLPSFKEKLNQYKNELANAGSYELSSLDGKIAKLDEKIKALGEDKQALIQEKGEVIASNRQIEEEKIPAQIELSNQAREEIDKNFDKDFVDNIALPKFQEEVESGKSLINIRSEYDDLYTRTQNKLRQIFNVLQELRREYTVYYKLSYDTTKQTNDEFDNELTLLRDVKLPEYQGKIAEAYEKATREFKDDFIFKLKTSIETVRSQIDELNEALKNAKFGSDSYQFTVTPAPQYREYYDMITDELLLTYGEDESLYFDKYKEVMTSLFALIGDVSGVNRDKDAVIQQNVEKFTDYRTYLMFDMMVSKGDGRVYSLAKNMKKQSGGETQTPFYVSILASFSQLYRIKNDSMNNSIRLVIFDEAFSKMDSVRIIESIKILKEFGLQVILSAPSEKVSDISKIADKTLLVSRQANRSFVDTFEIKK